MRHVRWLVPFVAALAAMWWAELKGLAVLATLVCGLAGLAYVVSTRWTRPYLRAEQAEQERDRRDVQREMPH
jgi:membrane protein implicated in regulation of membrane protease activity